MRAATARGPISKVEPLPVLLIVTLAPQLLLCQQDSKPEVVKTSITVIEKIDAEAPANIGVLNQSEIEQTPGVNLDDRLRDIPGFSLFRRSSSLVAHPTTQGISLRGIGSSMSFPSTQRWREAASALWSQLSMP